MRRVVRAGVTLAVPELAHSVHVEVGGLEPWREYYFQFRYRGEESPVGRILTAPSRWDSVHSLKFAFASCQKWDDGYYSAYRRLAEEDLAFVVHLGDYVYEYGIDENGGFRNVPVPPQFLPECTTLERYRLQHGLYKSDPDLQRAHERFPWIIAWDDHEVQNDYAGLAPEGGEPNPGLHRTPGRGLPGVLGAHPAAAGRPPAQRIGPALPAHDLGRPGRVQRGRRAPVPRRPALR